MLSSDLASLSLSDSIIPKTVIHYSLVRDLICKHVYSIKHLAFNEDLVHSIIKKPFSRERKSVKILYTLKESVVSLAQKNDNELLKTSRWRLPFSS